MIKKLLDKLITFAQQHTGRRMGMWSRFLHFSSSHRALEGMMHAPLRPQLIFVAARLGLADHLKNTSQHSEKLAQIIGVHAQALHRAMRGMAAIGLLKEEQDGRFSLTSLGAYLQSDHPNSLRGQAILDGELFRAWGGLFHTIFTGETAFEHIFGTPIFEYFAHHEQIGSYYTHNLVTMTAPFAAASLGRAYNFVPVSTLVDVGGGGGVQLATLLHAYPTMRGILFDQPQVIAEAQRYIVQAGLAQRCHLIAGDFFQSVPPGGDTYLLRRVLHDWNDEHARQILVNCRQAMTDGARLLLVERLMPKYVAQAPHVIHADLIMLVETGGRERTKEEYRLLLASAGFHLTRILPLLGSDCIIEGMPMA